MHTFEKNTLDIRLIYAQDALGGIGYKNKLPWSIKADMAHFKDLTTGCVVVMGRRTWESLPFRYKPLINRENVVVSSTYLKTDVPSEVHLCRPALFLKELKAYYGDTGKPIWVIGGSELFKLAIAYASKIERTVIHGVYGCDTFVEPVDLKDWSLDASRLLFTTNKDSPVMLEFQTFNRK